LSACWFLYIVAVLSICFPGRLEAFSLENPEQTGMAVVLGSSYDPDPTFEFSQLSIIAIYDYEQIMSHRAPEPLRFKIEGNFGLADNSRKRLLASANFLALYYLHRLKTRLFRPYIEGGAGIVYSDFQVKGQGLRLNFNPQAGIGTEWQSASTTRWYSAVRVSHISNGGLHRDNRGINAVTLMLGIFFY